MTVRGGRHAAGGRVIESDEQEHLGTLLGRCERARGRSDLALVATFSELLSMAAPLALGCPEVLNGKWAVWPVRLAQFHPFMEA